MFFLFLQFLVLIDADIEFFSFGNYIQQFLKDNDTISPRQPIYLFKIITFILSNLFIMLIITLKFFEWHRATSIIKKENKLDMEVVKIHLYDQIATYKPEFVKCEREMVIFFLAIILNTLILYIIIPALTISKVISFFYVYMVYIIFSELCFAAVFSYVFINLKKYMQRHRNEEYLGIKETLNSQFKMLIIIYAFNILIQVIKLF